MPKGSPEMNLALLARKLEMIDRRPTGIDAIPLPSKIMYLVGKALGGDRTGEMLQARIVSDMQRSSGDKARALLSWAQDTGLKSAIAFDEKGNMQVKLMPPAQGGTNVEDAMRRVAQMLGVDPTQFSQFNVQVDPETGALSQLLFSVRAQPKDIIADRKVIVSSAGGYLNAIAWDPTTGRAEPIITPKPETSRDIYGTESTTWVGAVRAPAWIGESPVVMSEDEFFSRFLPGIQTAEPRQQPPPGGGLQGIAGGQPQGVQPQPTQPAPPSGMQQQQSDALQRLFTGPMMF